MVIHSFSIAYSAVEDRLLFQTRGDTANENFWVTRRGAMMLHQALRALLNELYAQSGVQSQHLSFAQSFGQEYASAQHAPFADALQNPHAAPQLLFRIDYGVLNADLGRLLLLNEAGIGQELHLNTEMLHALVNLLTQQCEAAEWSLPLAPAPTASTSDTLQKTLH